MTEPLASFWYWQCVGCERIVPGGKELPGRCTNCDHDCWRSPPAVDLTMKDDE